MTTLRFSFLSEFPPLQKLKIKIEINCREHLNVLGFRMIKYGVNSEWYKDECEIRTYKIEEMLGTKLRAVYQRKKGRDLYDIFKSLKIMSPDRKDIIGCYKKYMHLSGGKSPSAEEFEKNLKRKLSDSVFLGDIKSLIRPDDDFDSEEAYYFVLNELVRHIYYEIILNYEAATNINFLLKIIKLQNM